MATSDIYLHHFPLIETDINSVKICWKIYMCRYERFLFAINITTDLRKRALLLHYGDLQLQDAYKSLVNTGTTYGELKTASAAYFYT